MKTDVKNPAERELSYTIDRRWQQVLACGALPERDVQSANPAAPPVPGAVFEVMP